jgi:hypothetical protein
MDNYLVGQGVTSQKTCMSISTAVRTSNTAENEYVERMFPLSRIEAPIPDEKTN